MTTEFKEKLEKKLLSFKDKEYDIVLGMSGGVDSTYSLLNYLEKGKRVLGIYLDLFDDKKGTSLKNAEKAKKLADKFNIDFKVIEAKGEFKKRVQRYFVETYTSGKTPNPCSICNRDIKINILYEIAKILNIPKIATGHYAGVSTYNGYKVIRKGKEPKKEQSYFLTLIDKRFLEKLEFPLQDVMCKEDLRKELIDKGVMDPKSTSDSQDICFLQNGEHENFCLNWKDSETEAKLRKTNLYLPNGKVTDGKNIFSYTVGQRKGLNISYNEPLYVSEIKTDLNENKIILDTKENMYKDYVIVKEVNLFVPKEELEKIDSVNVKLRYSKNEIKGKIEFIDDYIKIVFDEKQIKGAKGQICAIYVDEFLLGGGVID